MNYKSFSAFLVPIVISLSGDFYSMKITTINGSDKSLSVFKGKNILIVTLPSTTTSEDSAFLKSIDTISTEYVSRLSIIAVPSFEDGYTVSKAQTLRNFYNTLLGQQITITEAMFTHKTSASQHDLFFWLTHTELNTHFDMDVQGPGQKFFIDCKGELRAVLSPDIKLPRRFIERIINE